MQNLLEKNGTIEDNVVYRDNPERIICRTYITQKGCFYMANDKKDEHVITQRCSFCKREVEIHDSLDMPIYDPATGFGICKNCIKELAHYIELHEEDTAKKKEPDFAAQLDEILEKNKPHIIKQYLDEYIIEEDPLRRRLQPLQAHEVRLHE